MRLKIKSIVLLTWLPMPPNDKINEAKSEIPSITNLARTAAFTTVENKIPNVSDIIKKQIMIT